MNSREKPEEGLEDYFKYARDGIEVEGELQEIGFGEYLVDQKAISRRQLLAALQLQDRNPGVRLGECLAALGYLPYRTIETLVKDWESVNVVELEG